MAASPVLRDLSGNGHDATCYNFAWSLMSGIGGYSFKDLELWTKNTNVELNVVTSNKVTILNGNANSNVGIRAGFSQDTSIKIKVEGSSTDNPLIVYKMGDKDGTKIIQTITEDNVYTIGLEFVLNTSYQQISFACNNITIEQLPIYPNALVSDGVDDYAQVTGLPILTKERGYTVVAKRKIWHDIRNAFVSKCTHWLAESEGGVNGAFNIQANGSGIVYSFGKSKNEVPGMNEDVIYQTSKLCNGSPISVGDLEDTEQMSFFSINSGTTWYTKAALYSFLLFDRDLTEQEIEWVKTNMIESGGGNES